MPMRLPPALALAVLVLLLAVGCGSGHSAATTTTGPDAARWAAGLRAWGHGMRGALDGMSELFASPAAVSALEAANRVADAKLARYETTLDGCSTRLARIGPAPSQYESAFRFARQACTSLERGSTLVRKGLKQFQAGLGSDLFSQSTQPLSVGQSDVELATQELSIPSG